LVKKKKIDGIKSHIYLENWMDYDAYGNKPIGVDLGGLQFCVQNESTGLYIISFVNDSIDPIGLIDLLVA
jgi:hypothetical protein